MDAGAPGWLQAIEASGAAAAIRGSVWIYPVANVGHVAAMIVFAVAVAVMDLAILGAFRGAAVRRLIDKARRVTLGALAVVALTGLVLFAAEASHVALNPVFQAKMMLLAIGLLNALLVAGPLAAWVSTAPVDQAMPLRLRAAAVISLAIWLLVAALGRTIAYV